MNPKISGSSSAPGEPNQAFIKAPPPPIPDALAQFDLLPDLANVRLPVVCALFASSPATIWRRVKKQSIPTPRKLSEAVTAWNVGELRKALRGGVLEMTDSVSRRACDIVRDERVHQKGLAARKAVREAFRSFLSIAGDNPEVAAQLTIAWSNLVDGNFKGDQR